MTQIVDPYEKRLYFFVPYNISDIQKGIQAGHVALEYADRYGDDPYYKDFIRNWKTWIILNGGTTNNGFDSEGNALGSLNDIAQTLLENNIDHAVFQEPDLNNALTAVCFLADEKVFNFKDYPDYLKWVVDSGVSVSKKLNEDDNWMENIYKNDEVIEEYLKTFQMGRKQFILKNLISGKRLA